MDLISSKNRKIAVVSFAITACYLIINAGLSGGLVQTISYLGLIIVSVLITEFLYKRKTFTVSLFEIKNPKTELQIVLLGIGISYAAFVTRFLLISDWNSLPILYKLPFLVLILLFVYPVFFLIYFKFVKKYSFQNLGFSFNQTWIGVPVVVLFAFIGLTFFPEKQQFTSIIEESGFASLIYLGLFTAAIPEEFTRFLFQTRLIAKGISISIAWLIVALVWTFGHFPNFYSQSDALSAFHNCMAILPLGFLWGYLVHRTGSILPTILIHSLNLWGMHHI
ncbi:CPBP family intramembrane metalloprotease [bacterium]|nr:MAG: CPBP family intramembrane metalloprotease [bacterium]